MSDDDTPGNMAVMSVIRSRTSSDLSGLVDIAARVQAVDGYPVYLPDRDFHRFLTDPSPLAAWVAVDDGGIVGHVAANSLSNRAVMEVVRQAGIDGDVGVIARLLVDPSARRRGIGRALLEHARSHIASLGRTPVLDVVASATPAVSLYESAGWMKMGEVSFAAPGLVINELVFAAPI